MTQPISPTIALSDLKNLLKAGNPGAPVTLGTGPESVYLYFDPMERALAQAHGWPHWRCKLGHTSKGVPARLLDQKTVTAFAYPPVWALWFRSHNARGLEEQLQEQLTPVEGALGCEWFWTTPSDVLALYEALPETPPKKPERPLKRDHLTLDELRQVLGIPRTDPRPQLLVEFIWHTGCELHTALSVTGANLQKAGEGYMIKGRGRLKALPSEFVEVKLGNPTQSSKCNEKIFDIHPRMAQRYIRELGEDVLVDGLNAHRIRRSTLGIV